MKGLVTREMAIEQCITDAKVDMENALASIRKEDVTYADVAPFGNRKLINKLISAKWALDFPEDFVNTRCTDEDDYKKAQGNHAYDWYIAMLNGVFDPRDSYGLSDRTECFWSLAQPDKSKEEIREAWKKEFRSRLDKVIDEIMNSKDIRVYAMIHIKP